MKFWLEKLIFFAAFILVLAQLVLFTGGSVVGVNYGLLGDNLPPATAVINLFKAEHIPLVRLFEPRADVLNALRNSGIKVSLGTRNEDLPSLAGSPTAAAGWVRTWILPYKDNVDFTWVTLGNEVVPGNYASCVAPAMANMQAALASAGLTNTKVSTVVAMSVLSASYPPSAGVFSAESAPHMSKILSFLARTGSPIFVNCYPYFAYAAAPQQISLDYALFRAKTPVVDGNLKYYSLFDAMVDAFIAAMEKISRRYGNLQVVVGESGWPTAGNPPHTTVGNAHVYNQNLIKRVKRGRGTPRRPGIPTVAFVFAMFNEDLKPGGVEQNWGIHYHDGQRVYPLRF
ncbi:hypothetical protein Dimus_006805 [Dionaea muscipula]